MAEAHRPLSPHLQIWKWGPHMAVSIVHRATGTILATAGVAVLVWWLLAIASGPEAYQTFSHYVVSAGEGGSTFAVILNWLFRLAAFVVSWAFFQHMLSGIRHLVMDMGAGYELKTNKTWALATFAGSFTLTALLWVGIIVRVMEG